MSLPPEKVSELKQTIHNHLLKVSIRCYPFFLNSFICAPLVYSIMLKCVFV